MSREEWISLVVAMDECLSEIRHGDLSRRDPERIGTIAGELVQWMWEGTVSPLGLQKFFVMLKEKIAAASREPV